MSTSRNRSVKLVAHGRRRRETQDHMYTYENKIENIEVVLKGFCRNGPADANGQLGRLTPRIFGSHRARDCGCTPGSSNNSTSPASTHASNSSNQNEGVGCENPAPYSSVSRGAEAPPLHHINHEPGQHRSHGGHYVGQSSLGLRLAASLLRGCCLSGFGQRPVVGKRVSLRLILSAAAVARSIPVTSARRRR